MRGITVGGGGRMMAVLGMVAPRTSDLYMERAFFDQQQTRRRSRQADDSLHQPGYDGRGPVTAGLRHVRRQQRVA